MTRWTGASIAVCGGRWIIMKVDARKGSKTSESRRGKVLPSSGMEQPCKAECAETWLPHLAEKKIDAADGLSSGLSKSNQVYEIDKLHE